MKTTTVVEFSKKDIQDLLTEKARQALTSGFSSSAVSFDIAGTGDSSPIELSGAKVTFENLQPKNGGK